MLSDLQDGSYEGMLGNFDSQPGNDIVTPTGTSYTATVTDRELYQFGQTCKLLVTL